MKIRMLIIAAVILAIGYGCTPATAQSEPENLPESCTAETGCIDFNKHPELIGGGIVLEPTEPNHEKF